VNSGVRSGAKARRRWDCDTDTPQKAGGKSGLFPTVSRCTAAVGATGHSQPMKCSRIVRGAAYWRYPT